MTRVVTVAEYAKEQGCAISTARVRLNEVAIKVCIRRKPVVVYGVAGHQQVKVKEYVYTIPDKEE